MKQTRVAPIVFSLVLCVTAASDSTTGRCPLIVDRCLTFATGIAVSGSSGGQSPSFAYVGAGEVLKVVDVSDRADPVVVESLVLSKEITTIVARRNLVYVWTVDGTLRVIDVRDPNNPLEIGSLAGEGATGCVDVEISGNVAVVSSHSVFGGDSPVPRIRLIDLSDPFEPTEITTYGGLFGCLSIFEEHVFALAPDSPGHGWSLEVIDISDPEEPVGVGSYRAPEGERAFDIAAEGPFAYVATSSGLAVIDASDPSLPFELNRLDMPVTGALEVNDGYLFAQLSNDFHVVDVRDPSNPVEVGFCEIPQTSVVKTDMAVLGGHVLLAHGYHGLVVVDVGIPSEPRMAGQLCGGWTHDIEVAGHHAYWLYRSGWRSGLRISDISDPANPTVIGCYETDDWLRKIAVSGSHAFVASEDAGLRVIDVADPSSPLEAGMFDTEYRVVDVAVANGHAYLLEGTFGVLGLRILDLSDPAAPRETGWHTRVGHGPPKALALSEDRAFISTASRFAVIDVSDPAAPYEIAALETPAGPISISRSRAYVAAGEEGLRIIDISEPSAPHEVGFLLLPSRESNGRAVAISVAVAGRRAYVGTQRSGLLVIDVSNPKQLREISSRLDGWYPAAALDIAIRRMHAFLAIGSDGSAILDISACQDRQYRNRRRRLDGHW